ncbi:MAG: hypothetical protein P8Y36_08770, partial [Alphaproteobacteria bacterium]
MSVISANGRFVAGPSALCLPLVKRIAPTDVILHAVYFYVRYAVSYRDLEEIMAERGVPVD